MRYQQQAEQAKRAGRAHHHVPGDGAAARAPNPQPVDRSGPARVEPLQEHRPAGPAAPRPSPPGPSTAGRGEALESARRPRPGVLAPLQRAAGNRAVVGLLERSRAVGRRPVLQRKREDKAGLLAMTVSELDRHRKAEQMDWANTTGLSEAERSAMWGMLEWGTGGLATYKVTDVLAEVGKSPAALDELRTYCAGVDGQLDGKQTVTLDVAPDVVDARKQGRWPCH